MGEISKAELRRRLIKGYTNKGRIPDPLYKKFSFKAPTNFSLLDNAHELTNYFNGIINFMTKATKLDELFLIEYDIHEITSISIDTLMYMLALSNFIKKKAKFRFGIILPTDEKIRSFILSTGMSDYVSNANSFTCPYNKNYYSIKWGDKIDNSIAQSMCDFTNKILNKDIAYSKFLYSILVEMMLNTTNHAYLNKEWNYIPQWYVFAEDTENSIKFTFLDVGMGIPDTMINNIYLLKIQEVVKSSQSQDIIFFKDKQSELLIQTLREGNFVSRTKQKNRGKGLPQIYEQYLKGKTSNFKVLSGKGLVFFDDYARESAKSIELEAKFIGTLFYWEIDKAVIYEFKDEVMV